MDKIFEMLGVEKLDESKQSELKETLQTVVDLKSDELAESKVSELLKEEKEKLVEEFETKFDTYKNNITSKFSNFVDGVIDEEMIIPENVIKYAKLGELYQDLIEQFKVRLAIDENVINDEVKSMLSEAKDEIISLRKILDEKTGTVLELEEDASEMAAQLYIRKKCDGLTESQKTKVINLLGDEVIKENIDKKFNTIMESLKLLSEEDADGDDDGDTFEAECPECGNKETLKEGDDMKCPECGKQMKKVEKKDDGDDKKKNESKSKSKTSLNEGNAWATYRNIWIDSLKAGE